MNRTGFLKLFYSRNTLSYHFKSQNSWSKIANPTSVKNINGFNFARQKIKVAKVTVKREHNYEICEMVMQGH